MSAYIYMAGCDVSLPDIDHYGGGCSEMFGLYRKQRAMRCVPGLCHTNQNYLSLDMRGLCSISSSPMEWFQCPSQHTLFDGHEPTRVYSGKRRVHQLSAS